MFEPRSFDRNAHDVVGGKTQGFKHHLVIVG
jgi:hypothetical protein